MAPGTRTRLALPLFAAASALAGAGAGAAELRLVLDPAESRVAFSLDATLHTVRGTARLEHGEVRFDPASGAASGEIVVDARSAETGNGSRDRDMHRKVLDSADFPQIVLEIERLSGEFAPAGRSDLRLGGRMRLQGGAHPIEIPVQAEAAGEKVTAKARFTVPYVAWGLPDPSTFVLRVGKQVAVEVAAVGRLVAASAGAAAGEAPPLAGVSAHPPALQRVAFAADVQPILERRCQPCHFPGGIMHAKLPFDRAATILALGERLFTRIEDPAERARIRRFLAQEAAAGG
ncbi:MAG TPA: YceI family protein [Thermoanaerobaculia bacterium]|nr:YceI family protein [Thermoanaerobaculia bacterium]